MGREDKVISLGLAKQIDAEHKRLGIEVESEWWWIRGLNAMDRDAVQLTRNPKSTTAIIGERGQYPAYDTAELGILLQKADFGIPIFFSEYKKPWKWHVGQSGEKSEYTEIEARGQMYLHLLKEGYATAIASGEIIKKEG